MNATAHPPSGEVQETQAPGPYEPRLGDVVEDTAARKFGKVLGFVGPYVQLRPIGGGIEWDARPDKLRPATAEEAISAGVARANARSRAECP
ncbi:hypothetical protein [Streptomyces sp. CC219B]|uniref:hypothetical protein n=1 Tax=Streptomyces sp. CC219B TaxID=3044574 RepID=UPI0024A84ED0|nr:hypothetical protein [Streptomyces sp. CC219B]